jgi:IS605 OrfB family transposase
VQDVAQECGVHLYTNLLTLSTGEKIASPRHERRDRAAPARQQRRPAKKEKGSANRARVRLKVAKIHARIADRRDSLHKLATRLVRENQTIVIEDLAVRSMVKNHRLARAISDAAWGEFRSMLEYKAPWYGREVIAVDRWFPSSRLCSACDTLRETMPLHVRTWTCDCGATHHRDVNAAHLVGQAAVAVVDLGSHAGVLVELLGDALGAHGGLVVHPAWAPGSGPRGAALAVADRGRLDDVLPALAGDEGSSAGPTRPWAATWVSIPSIRKVTSSAAAQANTSSRVRSRMPSRSGTANPRSAGSGRTSRIARPIVEDLTL